MRISTNQIFAQGANNIETQQSKLLNLQNQLSTGLRVQTSADDPVASAQIELMNQRLSQLALYKQNNQSIASSLNTEDGVLSSVTNTIQSLQQLQVQAGSGVLSPADRQSLAVEAKNLLGQLQQSANSTDTIGNYMFAGSVSNTAPISVDPSNNYVYNGDSTQRFQAISDSMQVAINDTGDNLFMKIPAGNGNFSITQPATPNAGTGVISTGSVSNPAAFAANIPGDYTISFAGAPLQYTVTNNTTSAVVTSGNYTDGGPISFNGMSVSVTGNPAISDSFNLKTNQNESIFSTVQRMINNLNSPSSPAGQAASDSENSQILMQLANALNNVSKYRSDVGARLNQLDSVGQTNDNLNLLSQETLNTLQQIDPVQVATSLNQQIVNLQAAQQSFVRIQNLSVFNYIN